MRVLSPAQVKPLLTDGAEIAFVDVREHGQYGEGHPFFCVNLPYSKIEGLAPRLMPRRSVRCVVLDAGDGVAERAAAVLQGLGYGDVSVLAGGAAAWEAAGFNLFKGVNGPSKAFGEVVEHELGTPSVSAEELLRMQAEDCNLLVLDGRSEREFQKMSLPGARSCPNAELAYRLPALARDPDTEIVVNCAGRTRSIIGAETLRLLGLPNRVRALRNGTQGWQLAGFQLRHGERAQSLPDLGDVDRQLGLSRARALQRDYRLNVIDLEQLRRLQAEPNRSTFLFDVRSAAEFARAHVDGARHAPGGQLVQATDEQLAVRNARIVLSCDKGLRATTTAIWLAGMGHEVHVLDEDASGHVDFASAPEPPPIASTLDAATLRARVDAGARVLDVSLGMAFRAAHIKGAQWGTRARLEPARLGDVEELVVVGRCPALIAGAVRELASLTGKAPRHILHGTPADWEAAGLSLVATPDDPSEEACIDHLFFVHDRHDGNLDAARRYLEWELGLLAQLDAQERSVLKPLRPVPSRQGAPAPAVDSASCASFSGPVL